MKVIEDFESRPHKAATLVVERGKERQEWNEQTLPKALRLDALWKQGSNGQRWSGVRSDATGLFWMLGTVCVCAQPPRDGMSQGDTGLMASSSSLLKKEPMVLRELVRFGPSIRPHGELLFFLMQKKPALMPDSEAFNSFIGDDLLIPELKAEVRLRKTIRQTT